MRLGQPKKYEVYFKLDVNQIDILSGEVTNSVRMGHGGIKYLREQLEY